MVLLVLSAFAKEGKYVLGLASRKPRKLFGPTKQFCGFEVFLRLFGCENISGPSRNGPLVGYNLFRVDHLS